MEGCRGRRQGHPQLARRARFPGLGRTRIGLDLFLKASSIHLLKDIEGSDSEAERIIAEFEDAPKSPSSARSAPSSPPSSPNSGRSDQRINGAEDTSFRALGGDLKANKEVCGVLAFSFSFRLNAILGCFTIVRTGLDASWILEDALLVWHEAAMATGVDLPICKRCARRLAIEQREKIKEYEIEIKRMEDVRKALSEEEPAQTAEEMEAEITQVCLFVDLISLVLLFMLFTIHGSLKRRLQRYVRTRNFERKGRYLSDRKAFSSTLKSVFLRLRYAYSRKFKFDSS